MNAIILAAGKSSSFAPFTYEKPKGLFSVKGEVLIERQILQLHEANITEIYIVIGYMKEKFFYLEEKYGVKLIVNNQFGKKGNLYSLYLAREHFENTFICCADQYFIENPFLVENRENVSYRACTFLEGKFDEFAVECSDANVITNVSVGGKNSYAMVGHAYMNKRFSALFSKYIEEEIHDFGVSAMFWEEFYAKHIRNLTFYIKEFQTSDIKEFDSIDDLCEFDSEFLMNVDSDILSNICKTLGCEPIDIYDISVINAGLTNVSFAFCCGDKKYVYRHPGGTARNLIDRNTELIVQELALSRELDKSFIKMDVTGWKISHYVEGAENCDFETNEFQLLEAMKYLRELHSIKTEKNLKEFNNVEEGKRLMKISSATKGNLEREFKNIIDKIDKLYRFIEIDAVRLNYEKVICHNDTYAPNFLTDKYGDIFLIDWEYAGLNYAANDIGCILCRYDWSEQQINRYLEAYFNRKLTADENRFYKAYIPISAFYWFCWGLYKGSVGDDDSFFFLTAYRNLVKYLDIALDSYEEFFME